MDDKINMDLKDRAKRHRNIADDSGSIAIDEKRIGNTVSAFAREWNARFHYNRAASLFMRVAMNTTDGSDKTAILCQRKDVIVALAKLLRDMDKSKEAEKKLIEIGINSDAIAHILRKETTETV